MDNLYLLELINETRQRGGGLLLNYEDKPSVVVLTVEKYNSLLNGQSHPAEETQAGSTAVFEQAQTEPRRVLVTGGAGYIGGHLVSELIKKNFEVVVLDNLSTGRRENIHPQAIFVEGDLSDENLLRDLFAQNQFEAVFHMAASLEVEESVREPEKYLLNNVINTQKLLAAMNEAGVKKIIFSSTAAVYGEPEEVPIAETGHLRPNNPYGSSKLLAERLIKYYCENLDFKAVVFRYFNACGFDVQSRILPTHQSHLIFNVMAVANGERPALQVFGNDYPTFDGTCVRDYVHVLDIVLPHISALDKLAAGLKFEIINIGTGKGYSVAQIINGASEILNKIIPMEMAQRRQGDAAVTVADNSKLKNLLGYELTHSGLPEILASSWEVLRNF